MVYEIHRIGESLGETISFTASQKKIIIEFKIPQSKQQAHSELWEIKQRDGESSWKYNQIFKYVIGKLANPIHEYHQ
jgi:hypothetical protein